jgi:hypothetical protein
VVTIVDPDDRWPQEFLDIAAALSEITVSRG